MHLSDLKSKPVTELVEIANANELEGANRMRKHDLIFAMLKQQASPTADAQAPRSLAGAR